MTLLVTQAHRVIALIASMFGICLAVTSALLASVSKHVVDLPSNVSESVVGYLRMCKDYPIGGDGNGTTWCIQCSRIFMYCAGVTVIVGGVQVFGSVLLIAFGGEKRIPRVTFWLVNFVCEFIIITLGFVVFITRCMTLENLIHGDPLIQVWLATGICSCAFYDFGWFFTYVSTKNERMRSKEEIKAATET